MTERLKPGPTDPKFEFLMVLPPDATPPDGKKA